MLDQFKQMKQLRELQKELKGQEFEGEHQGVFVTINGAFELKNVKLNSDLSTEDQEEAIKNAFQDAMNKAQSELKNKLGGGGLGF